MSDLTKTEAIEKADRLTSTLQRMRRQSAEMGARTMTAVGIVSGGVISGVLQAKLATIPGTNVDTGQVVGGIATVVAISGWVKDEQVNNFLLGMGGGLLAAEAKDLTIRALSPQLAAPSLR